jgi:hypothetical protein
LRLWYLSVSDEQASCALLANGLVGDPALVGQAVASDLMNRLVEAVSALNPEQRGPRWASLSSCLIDAVWSIGLTYKTTTVPTTRAVFAASADEDTNPLVASDDLTTPDPVRLDDFAARFPNVESLLAKSTRHRTSPTGGILKADAVLRHVAVLAAAKVQTRQDALDLMNDDARFAEVNAQLSRIPGEGANGIRRGYLWMLLGDDNGIKPDRMVLRWLAAHGTIVKATEAAATLRRIATELSQRSGTTVTPWMVDHAVWSAGRNLPAGKRAANKTLRPMRSSPPGVCSPAVGPLRVTG